MFVSLSLSAWERNCTTATCPWCMSVCLLWRTLAMVDDIFHLFIFLDCWVATCCLWKWPHYHDVNGVCVSFCKDDQQSQCEMLNFDPATTHVKCWTLTPQPPMNPLSDRHQIWYAWLCHGYLPPRRNRAQSIEGFRLSICAKYTPHVRYTTLQSHMFTTFFWFFQSHLPPQSISFQL